MIYVKPISFPKILQVVKLFQYIEKQILSTREIFFLQRGRKPEIVQVIAPYQATSSEQLDLQRGQLIMIRKKTDSGWWEGELQVKGISFTQYRTVT